MALICLRVVGAYLPQPLVGWGPIPRCSHPGSITRVDYRRNALVYRGVQSGLSRFASNTGV
jgi:hypothetical protein